MYIDLAYGSRVSLKNNGYGGGLLHSHIQHFPTGSEQQQVTCYHHKDTNNQWIVEKAWEKYRDQGGNPDWFDEEKVVEMVKDGDLIRLSHAQTSRNLHSHNIQAPISRENEVSGYGNATFGDANDVWRVEVVKASWGSSTNRIRSLSTQFRLRHYTLGCLLRSHSVNLPQWGFKQAEVVCQTKPDNSSFNNMWNIELHVNDDRMFCD
jgi:dolichyl-phosphate-mannose-protein mannosyltransferase